MMETIRYPQIPFALLQRLPASRANLLRLLSGKMTDAMLRQIAQADYGYKADDCFKMLKAIVHSQRTPETVDFILGECLELTRWTLPDTEGGHLIRAFCSTVLLILEPTSNLDTLDENATLATLLDSIQFLGKYSKEAQELIVWRILFDHQKELEIYQADGDDQDPDFTIHEIQVDEFFAYALLLAMIMNREGEEDVNQIVEWLVEQDQYQKNLSPFFNSYRTRHMTQEDQEKPFLLWDTYFTSRQEMWKQLTANMKEHKAYIQSPNLNQKLDAIIKSIMEGK